MSVILSTSLFVFGTPEELAKLREEAERLGHRAIEPQTPNVSALRWRERLWFRNHEKPGPTALCNLVSEWPSQFPQLTFLCSTFNGNALEAHAHFATQGYYVARQRTVWDPDHSQDGHLAVLGEYGFGDMESMNEYSLRATLAWPVLDDDGEVDEDAPGRIVEGGVAAS
jgi:hypothetical protein